jgi:transposase
MGRFVEAEDRRQSFLLPQSLDDYVTEDNPVRVIEVFIDELDLGGLGFAGVRPATTGLRSGRCVASSLSFAAG